MSILRVAELIRQSSQVVVITGAGISTPSGIPDFRSSTNSLWNNVDAMEVASIKSFNRNPQNFYDWIRPLAAKIQRAKPNKGHAALAQMEHAGFIHSIITQNIDGLHQKANSKNVIEIHGNTLTMTCNNCGNKENSSNQMNNFVEKGNMPRCSQCNHILKPDVILFGEQLPTGKWELAEEAVNNCDLLIVAGSSLEVMPVAGLPNQAHRMGTKIIMLNRSKTHVDNIAEIVIRDDLASSLPKIVNELQ